MSLSLATILGDRKRFKSHFRTIPTDVNVPLLNAKIIEKFGWRKLITITQAEDLFIGVIILIK